MHNGVYHDRTDAGQYLLSHLKKENFSFDMVLALPRGGVPLGYVLARGFKIPLDVFVVRKIGVPQQEELAMGAISMGPFIYLNQDIIDSHHISEDVIAHQIEEKTIELLERIHRYRENSALPILKGKKVILVDDGIATGATVRAAIQGISRLAPQELHLCVPVAAKTVLKSLSNEVDKIHCPHQPESFHAVGLWYEHFDQVEDKEVIRLLSKTKKY